ncbi:MAG: hypothetical protein ABII96_03420 [Candidatus Zixiibacteriota bacterium]
MNATDDLGIFPGLLGGGWLDGPGGNVGRSGCPFTGTAAEGTGGC